MKKLSDFKDSKIELKNISGGDFDFPVLSFSFINDLPGGPCTPGNYLSTVGTDVNGGDYIFTELEPNKVEAAPRLGCTP